MWGPRLGPGSASFYLFQVKRPWKIGYFGTFHTFQPIPAPSKKKSNFKKKKSRVHMSEFNFKCRKQRKKKSRISYGGSKSYFPRTMKRKKISIYNASYKQRNICKRVGSFTSQAVTLRNKFKWSLHKLIHKDAILLLRYSR